MIMNLKLKIKLLPSDMESKMLVTAGPTSFPVPTASMITLLYFFHFLPKPTSKLESEMRISLFSIINFSFLFSIVLSANTWKRIVNNIWQVYN